MSDAIQAIIQERLKEGSTSKPQVVPGVGPDAPVSVTAAGGKQSDSPYLCKALPPLAILAIAKVRKHGAMKYGIDNHRKVEPDDFLDHAIGHILSHMASDTQEDHLAHALCDLALCVEGIEWRKSQSTAT